MSSVYECHNAACALGTPGEPGRFTGGQTDEYAHLLTGNPEAKGGEGLCPNCGTKGKSTSEEEV